MCFARLSIAALLAVALSTATTQAQVDIDFGFLIGANQSTISGETPQLFTGPEFEYFEEIDGRLDKGRLGMTTGIFAMTRMDTGLNFRASALFAEQGGKGSFEGIVFLDDFGNTDISGDVSIKTTYIELPVVAIIPLPLAGGQWRAVAGLSFAFAMKSELRLDSQVDGYLFSDTVTITDSVFTRDNQAILGVEFLANYRETEFLFGVRYKIGLLDFENGIGADPNQAYKHNSIAATLGIIF